VSDDDERFPSWHTETTTLEKPEPSQLARGGYIEKARRLFAAALSQKSPATVRSYEESLASFASYLEMSSAQDALGYLLSLERLDADLRVLEYMGWMEAKGLSPSTIRIRLSALKFYVKTAYRAQWIDWTLETQGPPQETLKEVEGPSPEQFIEVLRITDALEGPSAKRNRLMVYMLSFMALRINECLSLDLEHINFKTRKASILRKGKRHKRETKTIPKYTMRLLRAWVKQRGDHPGPLFSNLDLRADKAGQRINRSSAYKFIRRLGDKAGMPKLHPHAFRHFSATEILELTEGDTRKAMKHTGHSSERVFNVYEDARSDQSGDLAQMLEDRWKNAPEETD
jgi:integrase/recombinase XerC